MNIYTGTGAHVELVGMEALNAKLRAIDTAWEQAADDATRELAGEVLDLAKQNAPVRSGALRDSGKIVKLAQHQYAVVFDTPYARRIERGFSGMDKLGRFYDQPARPYLRPALAEVIPRALPRTIDLLKSALAAANV